MLSFPDTCVGSVPFAQGSHTVFFSFYFYFSCPYHWSSLAPPSQDCNVVKIIISEFKSRMMEDCKVIGQAQLHF